MTYSPYAQRVAYGDNYKNYFEIKRVSILKHVLDLIQALIAKGANTEALEAFIFGCLPKELLTALKEENNLKYLSILLVTLKSKRSELFSLLKISRDEVLLQKLVFSSDFSKAFDTSFDIYNFLAKNCDLLKFEDEMIVKQFMELDKLNQSYEYHTLLKREKALVDALSPQYIYELKYAPKGFANIKAQLRTIEAQSMLFSKVYSDPEEADIERKIEEIE